MSFALWEEHYDGNEDGWLAEGWLDEKENYPGSQHFNTPN